MAIRPKTYIIPVHAANPLSVLNTYEERSTTISLWESKTASKWQKKNPTPLIRG